MKQPKRPHVRLRNFWKFVEKADGCWKWTGPKWKGYGMLGKTRAPRFSYELHHGPLFPGWVVCHRCDNPECTNPAHLFAASQQANLKDMRAKNRDFWRNRTHCKNGHEYTERNTRIVKKEKTTYRVCRTCENLR